MFKDYSLNTSAPLEYLINIQNSIDLSQKREMSFYNLGPVSCIKIGTGVMAELTF
jgi:hypothetical protein